MDWKKIGENALSGSLSSIGSGLITGGLNQLFAGANARRQFRMWKQMQDYMNEYNSPVKQVERLKQAGLNPGLMYSGNSGSSLQASVGAPSGGPGAGISADPMALKRMENETKLADAQAEYYHSLAEGQGNENRTFEQRFKAQMDLLKEQARKEASIAHLNELEAIVANATGAARIQEAYAIVEKLEADTDLSRETIKEITANIALKHSTIKLNEALAKKAESDIQVNEAEVRYLIAQTKFTYQNGELVIALKDKAVEETYRLKITHEEYEFLLNWQGLLAKEEQNLTDSERRLVNKQAAWMNKLNAAELTESYASSLAEVLKGIGAVMKAMR